MAVFNSPPQLTKGLRTYLRKIEQLPITLMLASVLAGLGIVQLTFHLGNMAYRTSTWLHDTQATRERIVALENDIRTLRAAEQATSDPAYLEILARCQGFVGETEKVIVATTAPDVSSENCIIHRIP